MIDLDACLLQPIAESHPPLLLLSNYLAAIQVDEILAKPELVGPIIDHIHDLVALTLGTTRDAARLQAIKKQVMDSLSNSALSVRAVAAQQGITPRYVHTLFEARARASRRLSSSSVWRFPIVC